LKVLATTQGIESDSCAMGVLKGHHYGDFRLPLIVRQFAVAAYQPECSTLRSAVCYCLIKEPKNSASNVIASAKGVVAFWMSPETYPSQNRTAKTIVGETHRNV
jgi:hypothetical protein